MQKQHVVRGQKWDLPAHQSPCQPAETRMPTRGCPATPTHTLPATPAPQLLREGEAVSPISSAHRLRTTFCAVTEVRQGRGWGLRDAHVGRDSPSGIWVQGVQVCTHVKLKSPQTRRPFGGSWEGPEEGPRPAQGGAGFWSSPAPTDSPWAESLGAWGGVSGVRGSKLSPQSPGCTPHPTPSSFGH